MKVGIANPMISEVKEMKVVCPFCKQVHEVIWNPHLGKYIGKTPLCPHWTGEYFFKAFFIFRVK
ncbi:MAG: hypothetical protein DRO05_00900 [Thermoproteota archaeon]|nr:MAG: hypothetical protein DRO05_00900 [Candidatus Korarchaeota archaeon]